MLIGENSKKTLPLMMLDFKGEFTTEYSMIYTSIVIASLPMILMYVVFQRSFISGLTQGAVKG
jgi:raffinose/stachyose/melibiose transport system permease protein